MLQKGTKLYSILRGSCPNCQEESMYVEKTSYFLSKIFKMHERCSKCGIKYKIEPSFFYGAMYVSYGLGVAIAIALFLLGFLLGFSPSVIFISIIVSIVVVMPFTLRLSRNIWINIFIHYGSRDSSVPTDSNLS